MAALSIQSIIDLTGFHWNCTPGRYPATAGLDEADKDVFVLKHSILHLTKSTGKLSALAEKADHGVPLTREEKQQVRILAAKLTATSINLARHFNMSAENLTDVIEAVVR